MATPAPLTRRLLAALETHSREDAGPLALADWAALSSLFDHELALLTRLAESVEHEDAARDLELRARAEGLRTRYARRAEALADGMRRLQHDRAALETSGRRSRAVGRAYSES